MESGLRTCRRCAEDRPHKTWPELRKRALMLRPPHRRSRAALQKIGSKESARTILIALAANVVIAIAKLITGLMSGSTALLAESAHSLADASNEVFLRISLRRSARPAD